MEVKYTTPKRSPKYQSSLFNLLNYQKNKGLTFDPNASIYDRYKVQRNESDPTNVAPATPSEQKTSYLAAQSGGDLPFYGFRKQAPTKPVKDTEPIYEESDVNIHYKIPILYEKKEEIPEDVLAFKQAQTMMDIYHEQAYLKAQKEFEKQESRKHSYFLSEPPKCPIPLDRYNDEIQMETYFNPAHKAVGKVLYDFQKQNPKELSIKRGDIIFIRKVIDTNWFEIEHNGATGLVPQNYIEILTSETNQQRSQQKARVKFNFSPKSEMELGLRAGDVVTIVRQIDANWYEGKIDGRRGILPVSYVEDLANSPTNGSSLLSSGLQYEAMYNYKPQNLDELELMKGDRVTVHERCDDGWFVGTSERTGSFGTFPGNYVRKF